MIMDLVHAPMLSIGLYFTLLNIPLISYDAVILILMLYISSMIVLSYKGYHGLIYGLYWLVGALYNIKL